MGVIAALSWNRTGHAPPINPDQARGARHPFGDVDQGAILRQVRTVRDTMHEGNRLSSGLQRLEIEGHGEQLPLLSKEQVTRRGVDRLNPLKREIAHTSGHQIDEGEPEHVRLAND